MSISRWRRSRRRSDSSSALPSEGFDAVQTPLRVITSSTKARQGTRAVRRACGPIVSHEEQKTVGAGPNERFRRSHRSIVLGDISGKQWVDLTELGGRPLNDQGGRTRGQLLKAPLLKSRLGRVRAMECRQAAGKAALGKERDLRGKKREQNPIGRPRALANVER